MKESDTQENHVIGMANCDALKTQPKVEPLPVSGMIKMPIILRYLGISRSTWLRWINAGIAPPPKIFSKRLHLWCVDEFRAFILRHNGGAQ